MSISLAALAVIFVTSQVEKAPDKPVTFTSMYSGLSFSYPESWELEDIGYLETLAGGSRVEAARCNETILMKRGPAMFKYLLLASSADVDYGDRSWYDIETNMQENYRVTVQSDQAHDLNFFRIRAPADSSGFGVSYYVPQPNGSDFFHQEAFILKRKIAYSILLITPLKGGGTDEGLARSQFTEIVDTVVIN
jgi:hypothetical protein